MNHHLLRLLAEERIAELREAARRDRLGGGILRGVLRRSSAVLLCVTLR